MIPRIWVTFALSILVHLALLIGLLPWRPGLTPWNDQGDAAERLEVELASQSGAAPAARAAPAPSLPSPDARTLPSARARPPPDRTAPPLLAVPAPEAPVIPAPAPAVVSLPPPLAVIESAQAPPSVGGDLSSYIVARRRARDEQSAAADDAAERRTRAVASDAPALRNPIADASRRRAGGVFEITRMTRDDAEFLFYGWNGDERRRRTQAYEVRLGDNGDMRIAVVRSMIAIIREHEQGEFHWHSFRLGRIVVLSARPADNAGLEDFMLQEFFESKSAAAHR